MIFKFIKGLYFILNIAIILALLILHFIIKDRTYEWSLIFYPFPLPVIIGIVVGLSIFLGKRRKFNFIVAGILLLIWLAGSFRFTLPEPIVEKDLEVVFWNTSREHHFEDAVEQYGGFPDVMVLAEASDSDFTRLQALYPQYHFYKSKRELSVFSKHPMTIVSDNISKYNTSVVHFETSGIHFFPSMLQVVRMCPDIGNWIMLMSI
ncbi:hypothetical protein [Pseudotamlana carrageenivorans]|uniref:Endonuclease n=1 Tax=Pseudotamlana carrageenivorans TaxID=2069432 RepID=A0A2I7SHI8_9FLAO|nr:hypothetical protein [Tamlana carrageenivorans]AUS05367.1 hypothetical protein C1A40_07695 [Tamlana carrageenivorans]